MPSATWAAGSDSVASFAVAPVTAAPFTMACWFRPTTDMSIGGSYNIMILCDKDASFDDSWVLEVGRGDGKLYGAAIDVGAGRTTGSVVTQNVWQHAVHVETASNDRDLYQDGVFQQNNVTEKTPDNADSVGIGREIYSTQDDSWTGQLYLPAIWNVALAQAEITALAAGAHPTLIRPASLVSCIDVRSNTEVIDLFDNTAFTLIGLTAYTGDMPAIVRRSAQILQFPPVVAAGAPALIESPLLHSFAVTRAANY